MHILSLSPDIQHFFENRKRKVFEVLEHLPYSIIIISETLELRVPNEIQKHNSMIFPWFSMINIGISMTIQCVTSNLPL